MRTPSLVPALVLLVLSAPAAAQAIPDRIPDKPGESPADRAQERMEERLRPTLSHFFAGGSVFLAPVTAEGVEFQETFAVGLRMTGGDALSIYLGARQFPASREPDGDSPWDRSGAWLGGATYEMSALRLLAPSEFARRASLSFGVGLLEGEEVSALMLDVMPTWHLLESGAWSLPVGVRFSLAALDTGAEALTTRAFVGLGLGLRHYFGQRERLESPESSSR